MISTPCKDPIEISPNGWQSRSIQREYCRLNETIFLENYIHSILIYEQLLDFTCHRSARDCHFGLLWGFLFQTHHQTIYKIVQMNVAYWNHVIEQQADDVVAQFVVDPRRAARTMDYSCGSYNLVVPKPEFQSRLCIRPPGSAYG